MGNTKKVEILFVYIDENDSNLYQLKQWLQTLERLSATYSVGVLYTSPAARELLNKTKLLRYRFFGQPHRLIETISPKLLLYPNQNVRNFHVLRYGKAVHAFVSHGESDKAYMYQNTIKRYDLFFCAGNAAEERISRHVAGYDIRKRMLKIGRPQINDEFTTPREFSRRPEKIKVFYAPTWEGVTKATRYTSIDTHGVEFCNAIMADDRFQLIYRPHPLSGSREASVKTADLAIREAILTANRSHLKVQHFIDDTTFGWQLSELDVMISDVSAVAYDWLATGKPLLLTKPKSKEAILDDFQLMQKLPAISAKDSANCIKFIDEAIANAASPESPLSDLLLHYYGEPDLNDRALRHAVEAAFSLQNDLAISNWPTLSEFNSRGSLLGGLRYLNFAVRLISTALGIWNPKRDLASVNKSEKLFVHFSDPFNFQSLKPQLEDLSKESEEQEVQLATNQISHWLYIKFVFNRKQSNGFKIKPVAALSAPDCEKLLKASESKQVIYLKHHARNHMLQRLNGTTHILWKPELDPLFIADRSISVYDEIKSQSVKSLETIERMLSISRPMVI